MVASPLVQPSTCGQDNGSIQVSLSGGAGELTYTWSHTAELNSSIAEGLSPGNYSMTVTDETGCSYTTTSIVTATPQPVLQLEHQERAACVGVLGSTSFLLLNFSEATNLGIEVHGVMISREVLGPDSARLVVNGLPAGDYSPMVVDENGCSSEVALRIEQDAQVQLGAGAK